MQPDLRDLFERALSDDPGPPPGDPAAEAMAHGARIRRRRAATAGCSAAALVAVLGVLIGVNVTGPQAPTPQVVAALPPMAQPPAGCVTPAQDRATDISIFLSEDVTDAQRLRLSDALQADGRLVSHSFETREQAYRRFVELWRDSPDFVRSVGPDQLPESFRGQLRDPDEYPAVAAAFAGFAGIAQIVGSTCPGGGR